MRLLFFCLIALLAAFLGSASAQVPSDAALKFTVTLNKSPPSIGLVWDMVRIAGYDFTDKSFSVYRTNPANLESFGTPVTTIPIVSGVNTYSYTDTNVEVGVAYEYRVHCLFPQQDIEGMAVAGIEISLVEDRGHVILVVEEGAMNSLTEDINQLKMDLIGDGWSVTPLTVAKTLSVPEVRASILSAHASKPMSTIFILGSVPVPYSGQMYPDGHTEHIGAWPADVYYTSTIDDLWVDEVINNQNSQDPRNHNAPGDGKFDTNSLAILGNSATASSLEIGRVDLSKFNNQDEMDLLSHYLQKNHGYRHRDPEYTFQQRAVINDNFGWFNGGEAFSVSGWRAFSSVVGKDNIVEGNIFTTLESSSAIWCYGAGGGYFTGATGVGGTTDLLTKQMRGAFVMLFGSYLIDWDSTDNMIRAVLAGSHGLAAMSSGRPYAHFHHMGGGYHLGFSAHQSQANNGKYTNTNFFPNYTYQNLMGDPTLRMYVVDPPKNVRLSAEGTYGVSLTWDASSDTVAGYHVYRSTSSIEGPYTRATSELATTNSYVDTGAVEGTNYYMVRAVQLTSSPTASFYNPSQGAFFETNYVPPVQSPETANSPSSPSNGPASGTTPGSVSGPSSSNSPLSGPASGPRAPGAAASTATQYGWDIMVQLVIAIAATMLI